MNNKFEAYIDRVVSLVGCDKRTSKKIKEDLFNTLLEKQIESGISDPYELLGEVEEVAMEFRDNLGVQNHSESKGYKYFSPYMYGYDYEYVSKAKVLGIPLVHVVGGRPKVAKGIIAIGPAAIGVLAIGGFSMGIISIGGFSLALLLSLGGVSIAGFMALGGAAVSYMMSVGGVAVAKHIALGGMAIGDIAIGGYARGVISVYKDTGVGEYLFKQPANHREVMETIKTVYPNIRGFKLNIIKAIFGFVHL